MSGKPESPVPQSPSSPSDEALSRRRKLMRAAISGAPLMLSLPTTVSAQTVGSAFRAAINDREGLSGPAPSVEAPSPDGWWRIKAARLTWSSTTAPCQDGVGSLQPCNLYLIAGRYYFLSGQPFEPPIGFSAASYVSSDVYLLMLFDVGTSSISDGTPYPIVRTGTGLHRSAWASANPQGVAAYNGFSWVVGQ